jgi:hypothetical protein
MQHKDCDSSGPPGQAPRVTRFQILNAAGVHVATKVRTDYDDRRSKEMRWEQPDGTPGLNGTSVKKVPLYGSEALAARAGEPVFVVEGEKKRDALHSVGVLAVGTCTGASSCPEPGPLESLRHRDVVLWADNDDSGRDHMQRLAKSLHGVAATITLVEWRDAPEHGDAADFIEALEQAGQSHEQRRVAVHRLLRDAKAWQPPVAADRRAGTTGPRPTIIVRDELGPVTGEAVAALRRDPGLFVRGRTLMRVVRAEGKARRGLRRPPGAPIIEPLSLDGVRYHLDRAAQWVRLTAKDEQRPALPPEWVARAILALDVQPFRPLSGVVEAPTMRPDGTIISRRGYDSTTGLLLRPAASFPPVPATPSAAEVSAAVELLREPFADFPFVDESARAAVVSAVLSIVARSAIEGCVPMFPIRAPTPGTGKGLAADAVSIIGTGRPAARMAMPGDDDELRKLILAVALEAVPLVALDNIDRPLGSHVLAAALTAAEWTGRRLGSTAMVTAPLRAVWLATGNGLVFRGDLPRRVVPVDLDAQVEHPEDRTTFKHPDLLGWVREHRPGLVVAGLTILRGFHVAGRPAHGCGPPMGSFERWDDLIRGATVWAGLGDPLAGRERVRADDDGDVAALGAALETWLEALTTAPKTAAQAVGEAEKREGNGEPALRDALLGLTPHRDRLNAAALGYALRRVKGRVIRGRSFEPDGMAHGTTLWTVKVRGGHGGDGVTCFLLSRARKS